MSQIAGARECPGDVKPQKSSKHAVQVKAAQHHFQDESRAQTEPIGFSIGGSDGSGSRSRPGRGHTSWAIQSHKQLKHRCECFQDTFTSVH